MAKMVGYACNIKLQWLNMAVQLLKENYTEAEYKDSMNHYLSFEIDSPTRLRKTREILMNIWYYGAEPEIEKLRKEAMELLEKYPEQDAAIHLCMIYMFYPVVADICKYIGKITEFQDEVTNAALKQKLYDEWGERGSLETTCRRVTLTLKDMGILEAPTKTRYVVSRRTITNTKLINFMLVVAMKLDGSSYYSFAEMSDFPILFPYELHVSKEALLEDGRFAMSNFGGELSYSLND